MPTTGVVVDQRFRLHDTGPGHPECPERLEVLEDLLASPAFSDLPRIAARPADADEIARVHTSAHLKAVAASAGRAFTQLDPDTVASAASFEAARLAAGAALELADAVMDGSVDNGFAALRPPGHHAERDRPMGFCLFNNVAVVARHLRVVHGLERVLIVDWDVHHGNGTQHTFYDDPSVMYVSLHQYPFYPGSGGPQEIGRGGGLGRTVNVPMAAASANADYYGAFGQIILPIARQFAPQFVLVSAGFDAHRDDPLAMVDLDTQAFAEMTHALSAVAEASARGRLLLLLEGGYNLRALSDSVAAVLGALARPQPFTADQGELSPSALLARQALSGYWSL
ncbi:MAG: histone deacetylase [Deltaproteobacteria bacterium]